MERLIRYDDAIERLGAHLMADAQIDWGGTASTDIEDWKELADMILNGVPTIDAVSVVRGEMSDLIKRSDAIEAIEKTDWYHINRDGDLVSGARSDGTALYKAGDVYKALEAVPSARPNGEWIWHEDDDICNCSECEFEIDATGCIEPMEYVGVFRYCPNCGAKMKGADDEV